MRIAAYALLAMVASSTPAFAEFIDQMGGNTPTGDTTNLFGGGNTDEQQIEIDLKQRQPALYDESIAAPENQQEKGVVVVDYVQYKPVFIKVRNLAATYVFFPESEVIEDVLLGDGSVFDADFPRVSPQSKPTRKNVLILRLKDGLVGADTPMTAIGRLRADGTRRKYLFTVSGWSYRSETLSDFFVFIKAEGGQEVPAPITRTASLGSSAQIEKTPEYLREIPFEPTDISFGDYELKKPNDVSDDEVRKIMPRQIWTDGYWTYLQYGEQQADTMPWVVVRRVVDDVNSPVDYMRHPKKHNVLVVHSVGKNLYLRNGRKRVLCLVWVGGQGYRPVMQATSQDVMPHLEPELDVTPVTADVAPFEAAPVDIRESEEQ